MVMTCWAMTAVVWLFLSVDLLRHRWFLEHDADALKGKGHSLRWCSISFHLLEILRLESVKSLSSLLEAWLGQCQFPLAILCQSLGGSLMLLSHTSLSTYAISTLLHLSCLNSKSILLLLHLLLLSRKLWLQLLKSGIHLSDEDLSLVELLDSLLVLASL